MLLIALLDLIDSEEDKIRFEKFYYKYHDYIINISKKRLQENYHLAEDNCSLVFEYFAVNFDKIGDIDSKETKGYVYTVANGLAINMFYKEILHRPKSVENEKIVQKSDITFDLYSVTELKAAIEELTEEEKTYFRLKYLQGMNLSEIGRIYNVSASTVSRKLRKITQKLRERLGEK
ncbi:MAG TPA: hypothetical protein DCR23_07080 [Ruminococcaceae bacterium]|nr:hypothetical protein [Oscillospiraceae bacterium]